MGKGTSFGEVPFLFYIFTTKLIPSFVISYRSGTTFKLLVSLLYTFLNLMKR